MRPQLPLASFFRQKKQRKPLTIESCYLIDISAVSHERQGGHDDGQEPHADDDGPHGGHRDPDHAGPGGPVNDPESLQGEHHDAPDGHHPRHDAGVPVHLPQKKLFLKN